MGCGGSIKKSCIKFQKVYKKITDIVRFIGKETNYVGLSNVLKTYHMAFLGVLVKLMCHLN